MTIHQTRSAAAQKKVWKDVNDLEVPAELAKHLESQGYGTRWIRVAIRNDSDGENIFKRLREGYEFVTAGEAEANGWEYPPLYDTGKHGSIIRVGDLALAKLPLEISQDRDRQMAERNESLMRGINEQLEANARENRLAPVFNSSRSGVTTGGQKAVHIDKE